MRIMRKRRIILLWVLILLLSDYSLLKVNASEIPDVDVKDTQDVKTARDVKDTQDIKTAQDVKGTQDVRLTIDNIHVFDGMEKAYKNGYVPTISEDTAVVVLPLLADCAVQDEKIEVKADLGETKDSPFVYKNYQKTFFREEMKPTGEEEAVSLFYVRFDLELHPERKNGTYSVVMDITGRNEQGKAFSQKFTIYISITDGKDNGNSEAGSDNGDNDMENGGIGTGDGNNDVENGNSGTGTGDGNSDVENGNSGTGIDDMEPDSDGNIDGSASDGGDDSGGGFSDYGSGYDGGYGDSSGGQSTTDTPVSQPIVLVSSSSLTPGTVISGGEFTVTAYLKNTSEKKDVQNMVITLNYDTEKFTLKEESDTIYIASLKKGEMMEISVTLESHLSTPEGTYKIGLDMSYDNADAETLTSSGSVYVPVKQELNVELTMPKIAEKVTAGDTLPLSFQVMNLGRSKVYNVRCEVSGYGLFPLSTAFVGDMEPGTAQTADMNVFVGTKDQSEDYTGTDLYGNTNGVVTMYYEDAQGTEYTEEYSFITSIEKAVVSSDSGEEEEKTAGQWWVSVLIVGGIIAALGGYMTVKRRLSFNV